MKKIRKCLNMGEKGKNTSPWREVDEYIPEL